MGKLNWASQIICRGRNFLRRVLDLKNYGKERYHTVLLTDDLLANLQWWLSFMKVFNGTFQIQDPRPISFSKRDASSEGGWVLQWILFYVYWALDLPDFASEYINVKYFVVIFQALFRWCNNFLNKKMIMYSDNASHVSWLNKVRSRKPLIYLMFRILFWIFAIYNYAFSAQHLPGNQNNIADPCSRLHEPSLYLLKLYLLVPSLQYDTFSITTLFVVSHVITIYFC